MSSVSRNASLIGGVLLTGAIAQTDLRECQHGIDFLPLPDGKYYLVYSSTGTGTPECDYSHDIYSMHIDPAKPALATATARLSNGEAQEPSSSAILADGTILVTCEDGYQASNEIAQRYGVYDVNWNGIKPYSASMNIKDGGHSGHCAAVGNGFVVHWCDDWTDDGGVDNLGTGNTNIVNTISTTGNISAQYQVSTGRTWWPEIDGSETKACLIWQKYITGQMYAEFHTRMFDPASHTFTPDVKLHSNQLYYHYAVRYIEDINRFLVVASKDGGAGSNSGRICSGGLAWLIDDSGTITATTDLPDGIIRESGIIVRDSIAVVCRLTAGNSVFGNNSSDGTTGGIYVLKLTATSITLVQTIDDSYAWQYMGIDGIFTSATNVYIVALSKDGLTEKKFIIDVPTAIIPGPSRSRAVIQKRTSDAHFFDLRGRPSNFTQGTGVYIKNDDLGKNRIIFHR